MSARDRLLTIGEAAGFFGIVALGLFIAGQP